MRSCHPQWTSGGEAQMSTAPSGWSRTLNCGRQHLQPWPAPPTFLQYQEVQQVSSASTANLLTVPGGTTDLICQHRQPFRSAQLPAEPFCQQCQPTTSSAAATSPCCRQPPTTTAPAAPPSTKMCGRTILPTLWQTVSRTLLPAPLV